MKDIILIRYGELNTKGKNRKYFIDKLASNIKKALYDYPLIKIDAKRDRMTLEFNEYDVNEIIEILKNIFGIQTFSIAKKVETDMEIIEEAIMKTVDFRNYQTFKIKTKRGYKQFPLISDEINRLIATRILKDTNLKVKMKDYDLEINIDLRKEYSYIFFKKYEGNKGYPVGISGKGLLMLSGGIDSPVAGYMAMKRGIQLEIIHFASFPYTSKKALQKVIKLASYYLKYTNKIVFHNISLTNMQLAINKNVKASYSMTILRRMMYRIAQNLSLLNDCKIIINGESIAQVASQTLQSMSVINEVVNIPVIRPCACLDKLEIIALAKQIDTYETSILPYEDCCTIFLPPNPSTNPRSEYAIKYESNFDYESLIKEAINKEEKIIITKDTIKELLEIDEDLF